MKTLKTALFLFALWFGSGCASIVSHSQWPVYIDSEPPGARFSVENRSGKQVYEGITPAHVTLRSGGGYFVPQRYMMKFKKDGYQSVETPLGCTLNPWYFGNIFIGGVIGMVFVDPITGAMYKPETDHVNVLLNPKKEHSPVYINTLPKEEHSQK